MTGSGQIGLFVPLTLPHKSGAMAYELVVK
jgi:hypothetical protein